MIKSIKRTWRRALLFSKILSSRERWLVRVLIFIIIFSVVGIFVNFYLEKTEAIPKIGGKYTEGILGQPRFINPILAETNDADRDLVRLIYSSLFKYDGYGNLVPDIAESYDIESDNLTYYIYLKKNMTWHDGEPLTANDVIFTIKTIQDPEYKSPLRTNWQDVKVEKIDDFTVSFKLNNIYAPFLHNLTIGILPKHLWTGISAQNFLLAQYNLKPIGSGPYKFKELNKDENGKIHSIELIRNKDFYLGGPFIESIVLKFYNSQQEAFTAFEKKQVDGLGFIQADKSEQIRKFLEIKLPIYYAVFFNQTKSKIIADSNVRLALAYATDKQEIINKVFKGKAVLINSPLLPDWPGYNSEIESHGFDLEKAKEVLKETDFKEDELEITLVTTNWSEFEQSAKILQEQWGKIGIKVNLEIVDALAAQQEYIRPREYEALLFGEVLSAFPDPFAFWHSSQKKDPGLNLALYDNKDVDKLLEQARQTPNDDLRNQKYFEFQEMIAKDLPALFIYSPTYLYPIGSNIKGANIEKLTMHSQRFSQIENWYIKTKRIWKD